jgi:acyl-CoA dehydrogenase
MSAIHPPPEEDAAFLAEVRAFLAEALTPDLREAGRRTIGVHSDIEASREWRRRLYQRGWAAPAWPKAYGGAGWTARQRYLFDRECALNDAPVLFAGDLRSLGPLLIEQGTEDQKARFLPAMLTGEQVWCQGFSEAGAGSDLAALSTRAVREGDAYIVDGAKLWTTGAQHADYMYALVRTAELDRPQKGITFLLIDMTSPGLTVTPIPDLAGQAEFNQVFFDQVRVPVENRVGAENDGWTMAKRLMALARGNNTPAALIRRGLNRARQACARTAVEPALRARLADLEIALSSLEAFELAALPSGLAPADRPEVSSMLKITASELNQKVAELALAIEGPYGAAALTAQGLASKDVDHGALVTAQHLALRAATIYSGASETQRNIIAARLLKG